MITKRALTRKVSKRDTEWSEDLWAELSQSDSRVSVRLEAAGDFVEGVEN